MQLYIQTNFNWENKLSFTILWIATNILTQNSSVIIEIRKVLLKIAKEKNCEDINPWIKPCENHVHWSATSTFNGNGIVIWAKIKSFLNHIINKHSGHSDPIFNKCAHSDNIEPRKWLTKGVYITVQQLSCCSS